MKKLFFITILFSFILTGCSGKPGNDDLTKSFNKSFEGFKQVGVDLGQYLEPSGFDVSDSYEEGQFYIVKAIPIISIKENLDSASIKEIKEKTGMLSVYVIQMINMFEILKKYDTGEINQQKMAQELKLSQVREPEGLLKSGDEFKGLESEYKFRKTDNGWLAVE